MELFFLSAKEFMQVISQMDILLRFLLKLFIKILILSHYMTECCLNIIIKLVIFYFFIEEEILFLYVLNYS